ncbi:hypothetical protein JCM10212_000631 [Sporobolomyces blumeae]
MPHITLYSHVGGPNGWTVAFVLRALGIDYETKFLDFAKGEQKGESFLRYNPNGRIPAIVDHQNNDFVVWESKACMKYLVAKYDTEKKLGVSGIEQETQLDTWLFFQASGQGPYFGQAAHFKMFAPEKIPYAIDRYAKEVERVIGVLDGVLAKSKSGYLVGDKLTIADLSFITWNNFGAAALLPEGVDAKEKFPAFSRWHQGLTELPYVAEVLKERESLMKK